jgi:hypothetical protein
MFNYLQNTSVLANFDCGCIYFLVFEHLITKTYE